MIPASQWSKGFYSVLFVLKTHPASSARCLLVWAERHLAIVKAECQPGANLEADWLSRKDLEPGEWSLNQEVFMQITHRFRTLVMDLLAFSSNCQVRRFLLRFHNPRTEGKVGLLSPLAHRTALRFSTPTPSAGCSTGSGGKLQRSHLWSLSGQDIHDSWTLAHMASAPPWNLLIRPPALGPILHPVTAWKLKGQT